MIKDNDIVQRMMRTLATALGRPYPNAEQPPTREELLQVASVCAGAADMARELAKQARDEPT